MPLFALPLTPSQIPNQSKKTSYRLPTSAQKRKRPSSPSPSPSQNQNDDDDNAAFLAASTNPLSLTPAEIAQYKVAGLRLDHELPSANGVKEWPHRRLPHDERYFAPVQRVDGDESLNGSAADNSEDTDVRERKERGSHLRTQHLAVLVAILHRCLLEGDIERARRAWSMLLRAESGGKSVDIKGTGYWGIGAEVLIRAGEARQGTPLVPVVADAEGDAEIDSDVADEKLGQRWGNSAGWDHAKEYYERLILQYPYMDQYKSLTSAIDFWPAMLACEIYGIQYEHAASLVPIFSNDPSSESGVEDAELDYLSETAVDDIDGYYAAQERLTARQEVRLQERAWKRREDARVKAFTAASKVAARMDELMAMLPFGDSVVLLRLRGMVGLWMGDLSVPDEVAVEGDGAETRLKARERRVERERALLARAENREVARTKFRKAVDILKMQRVVVDGFLKGVIGVLEAEMAEQLSGDDEMNLSL